MSTQTLDTRLSMQVLLGAVRVKGEDLFSFQPIGRAKVPCFYFFEVSGRGGGTKFFFFSFPYSLMCSHGVPFKFLMGFQNVPQIHNVFLNIFSI